jgi:gamma-glutamyl:cysteine ligase YbdK (ATP-grasp superfamily)
MSERRLHLFEGYGIEIEYMIVDRATLDVRPISDRLLRDDAGLCVAELELGPIAWSNELAMHLIEMKTNGPARTLGELPGAFQVGIDEANRRLEPLDARLLPGGMHPWMDPHAETRLWPHHYSDVYETFHRIFDCRGHGWSNLQSAQLNLPFGDDDEFARLHAAIRVLLPILPALTASSPIVAGTATGQLDHRMVVYRGNCRRVPSVSGSVIPENARSRAEYERDILGRIYEDLAAVDPDGVLRHEWVNARGAIARFDRYAIEIRILDTQECAPAEIGVHAAISAVLRALCDGRISDARTQRAVPTDDLARILWQVVERAGRGLVDDARLLRALGQRTAQSLHAEELWAALLERVDDDPDAPLWREPVRMILRHGCLARRILTALDGDFARHRLAAVYGALADCLARGTSFVPT